MTTEKQQSSFSEENNQNSLLKDVEIKSIPFFNETMKFFNIKTSMPCTGTILVFGAWPGASADPSVHLKYSVKMGNESIHMSSPSFYFSSFTNYGYNFIVLDYPGFWFNSIPFRIAHGTQAGMQILHHIKNDYLHLPLYVYTHSFGSAMAVNCVAEFKMVDKMFFQAPVLPITEDNFVSKSVFTRLMNAEKSFADQNLVNSTETFWESPNDSMLFFANYT